MTAATVRQRRLPQRRKHRAARNTRTRAWSARHDEQRHSAEHALRSYARQVRLPMMGSVAMPQPDKVAYYAGMGVLAALQVIEWPLALVVTAGHLLADQHLSRVARGAGEALESA
ncbi:MAG TPA: hypothetical protein VGD43_17395 [Micromonospora sp.]